MQEPTWLVKARKDIGIKELSGDANNPSIVAYAKVIKRGGIKEDSVPWCATFVGAKLEESGIRSTRFESAKSYLDWGVKLEKPVLGCIVVFKRVGGGHVGFVTGRDASGKLLVLGGNQSDAVNIRAFGLENVVGYRWPEGVEIPVESLPVASAEVIKKVT